jgi:hypothetical protein
MASKIVTPPARRTRKAADPTPAPTKPTASRRPTVVTGLDGKPASARGRRAVSAAKALADAKKAAKAEEAAKAAALVSRRGAPAKAAPAKAASRKVVVAAPRGRAATTATVSSKTALARRVVEAIGKVKLTENEAYVVSQWIHHLPAGTESGVPGTRRWWPSSLPRPDRSDWR